MPTYRKYTKNISLFDLFDKLKFMYLNFKGKKIIDDCGNITIDNSSVIQHLNDNFDTYKSEYINVKISLTQNYSDLGLYQNFTFIEKQIQNGSEMSPQYRKIGVRKEKYFDVKLGVKSGVTDDKLDDLVGFGGVYKTIKDTNTSTYSGIIKDDDETIYIQNALLQNDTFQPNTGVKYKRDNETLTTTFEFNNQGFNEQNIDLQENVFDEIYLGVHEIDDKTEVVAVNRGDYNIFQQHLKLETLRF